MFSKNIDLLFKEHLSPNNHAASDYFSLIKKLVGLKNNEAPDSAEFHQANEAIARAYGLVEDEIRTNTNPPSKEVSFGTSGWRGIIGKDISLYTVSLVTQGIVAMYRNLDQDKTLAPALGVSSFSEAQQRGAVLGFDNRFGGRLMAQRVIEVLTSNGITVHYAHEATTGTLSAAVLILQAAFSINLTPSHNPLEYAGFKFNAADAGPAASEITNRITENARQLIAAGKNPILSPDPTQVQQCDALACWQELVARGASRHGLNYREIIAAFHSAKDCVVAVDCVHGASRVHMRGLFGNQPSERLLLFREQADPTFGGVAPEPSSTNMQQVMTTLQQRPEPLKLGVIIDPDADRIRFTDGTVEIDMNLFGGMAFHYLHEKKGKHGLVAKTVATSNFANAIAKGLHEEIFEPKVGFKEFKPVIGKALVCFEESDGISVVGHTPEKDAYIGLILALDMMLSLKKNLGEYLSEIQAEYGYYYPGKGGVEVSRQGKALLDTLAGLEKYGVGTVLDIGGEPKKITEVITIDGRKMILEDNSWLMIRPSGTEPKVRFYVEARSEAGKDGLFAAAKGMLGEIGLL
ncbi:phosphoglucomutase [Thiovibrio frasassiensis]|uniref:Phosphoglucomutase n=1 Tax=Thiovibrio frasassiensis TaxID=2984131 RepID=A0A9X4MGK3_9BACT|nr:phosphoglucomutase [Thiovibrio frasassiensis]MDG4476851.1 phosphoglucomutase [Thiovibrio frasassiensis]